MTAAEGATLEADAGPTIMLVEDDNSVREVLKDQLSSLGYRTGCARSAEEALDYKDALPRAEATAILRREADQRRREPRIVRAFIELLPALERKP